MCAVAAQAVSKTAPTNPAWTYQEGDQGLEKRDHTIRCLLAGIERNTCKAVNYDKLREISQGPDESPALLMSRLTEAMTKYTNVDPESREGQVFLHLQFISQCAPNIRKKYFKNYKRNCKPPAMSS